jgi:hypothetical protein
MRKKKC